MFNKNYPWTSKATLLKKDEPAFSYLNTPDVIVISEFYRILKHNNPDLIYRVGYKFDYKGVQIRDGGEKITSLRGHLPEHYSYDRVPLTSLFFANTALQKVSKEEWDIQEIADRLEYE